MSYSVLNVKALVGGAERSSYHKLRKLNGLTLKDTWELGDVLVRAAGAGEGLQNATFNHTYKYRVEVAWRKNQSKIFQLYVGNVKIEFQTWQTRNEKSLFLSSVKDV